MTDVQVERDDAERRYVARRAGREVGAAYFEAAPDDSVVFTHTEVDPDAQGGGVGSALARGALDDVRSRGQAVEPRCPFIARFIAEHEEYRDLVGPR